METPLDLRDVCKEELFSMVDHLFVPRKVSLEHRTRAEMRLAECLVRFTEDIGLTKLSGMLGILHKFHSSSPDSGTLLEHLSEPDFVLAVPLLDHNAVLLFESCPEPDEVLVSALDVLPHPSAIANAIEETAVLAVPRCVVAGSLRQVRSLAFLEQLSQLGKEWPFPGKDPEARKAGHSVIETRLPAKPIYVFDWLMATLEHAPSRAKHQVIYKTIRMDMIRANLKMGPWNRSDLWVAMKSSLHVSLVSTMGIPNGTRKYKETMALFAAAMVGSIRERNVQTQAFDYGQMREMCTKIARKAKKFEQRYPEDSVKVTAAIRGTCEAVDKELRASWASFAEDDKTKNFVDVKSLCQLRFSDDDVNPLTGAKQAIQSALSTNELLERMRLDRRGTFSPSSSTALVRNEEIYSGEYSVLQMMKTLKNSLKASGSSMFEREWALHAVELFVRTYLWPNKSTKQLLNESSAHSCYELMCAYHECANQVWNDPVEKSRLVLYMFTFGAVLDAISVSWDPLQQLRMHKLPFIEIEKLSSLLLRHYEEIVLLEELARYVESRTGKTLLPGILSVEHSSFSDVYARKDETMIAYEKDYHEEVTRYEEKKRQELKNAREKYESYRVRRDELVCVCKIHYDNYGRYSWKETCEKCTLFERMESTEYSVSVYERRLPDSAILRNAIIFHSMIPKVFRYYRGAVAVLIELYVPQKYWTRVQSSAHKWSLPNDGKISFGSSTKSFLNTHYSRRNPSILHSDYNFIVPQGKNVQVVLTSENSFLPSHVAWDITQHCTFTVSKPFTLLQFAVEGVKHTENSILTKQSSCPANLQLTAFKDFGTLRAGGFLQWRNIAMALENSFLDLSDPSVLQLLMQAMYQVGPTPVKENWNADLHNEIFVATLCQYLHLVLTRIEPSWNAVITMQACISVACYVAEHANIEFADAPLQVLLRCRRIAKAWSQSIEGQISDSASDYDRAANYLVIINGLIVLTYGVFESATAVDVLLYESSLYDFLRARAKICEFRSAVPTGTTAVLLRAGIRVSARFESEIQNLLQASQKPLDEVLFDTWNPRNIAGWSQCAGTLYWKTTCTAKDGTPSTVHFNVFDGTFLVDGEPAKGLPDRILHHPLFLRTFRRCRVSVFHRGGGIFETKKPLHRASFTFAEKGGNLIVREIFDGKSRALLDAEFFVKDLPGKLIVEQSHWVSLDPNDLDIQLRPVEITHPDFHSPNFVIKLDRSLEGQVLETETGRKMLNWAGNVFNRVYNSLLERLEDKTHALPFLPNHCKVIPDKEWSLCVTLPRLRLHVEFLASSVQIREFEGMRVSEIQTVGTFFGLEKMLVLESEGGGRTVLAPNIDLCFRSQHPHHVFTKDTWNIRNERIPVFAFTQDIAIRQLRPYGAENFNSWLMCAYLHAATSSAMPDPFTGLTGLEMAMIQLRRCYTNRPFDEASIDILQRISNLSVKRSKAHGTYVTFWDHSRSAYANSDALALLVNLLLRKNSLEERIPLDLTYNRRFYELYSWTYSPAALLNETESSILSLARKKPAYPPFHGRVSQDSFVRSVAHAHNCQKAMSTLKKTWNGFSWVEFLESFQKVSPVKKVENHVGY